MTVISGRFGIFAERPFGRDIIDDCTHANYNLSHLRRVVRIGLSEEGIDSTPFSNPRIELLPSEVMTQIHRALRKEDSSRTSQDAERYVLDRLHETPARYHVRASKTAARPGEESFDLGCLVGSQALHAEFTKLKLRVTKPLDIPYAPLAFVPLVSIAARDYAIGIEVLADAFSTEHIAKADLVVSDSKFFDV